MHGKVEVLHNDFTVTSGRSFVISSLKQNVVSWIGGVLKEAFGWVNLPSFLVLVGLVIFICAVFPSRAQGSEATLFVPASEEVEYPSVKILHPKGTDEKKVQQLRADFEKVGLQIVTSPLPQFEECQVAVTQKGYRFVCFSKSSNGDVTCKLGPVVGSRKETVELLGLYYRACPAAPRKPWS